MPIVPVRVIVGVKSRPGAGVMTEQSCIAGSECSQATSHCLVQSVSPSAIPDSQDHRCAVGFAKNNNPRSQVVSSSCGRLHRIKPNALRPCAWSTTWKYATCSGLEMTN